MDVLSAATPIQLGLVIALFSSLIGGIVRIDRRFNHLEEQMKTALKGRLTRQEHQIWVLQMQVRNPTLRFPDGVEETQDGAAS